MAKVTERAPVLLLPGETAGMPQPDTPETRDLNGRVSPFLFPHIPSHSSFEPRVLQPIQWAMLAVQRPGLMRDFLNFPHEDEVLREMTSAVEQLSRQEIPSFQRPGLHPLDQNPDWVEVTDSNLGELYQAIFAEGGRPHRTRMRVLFGPGMYKVEFGRPPQIEPGAPAMELGAWILSSFGADAGGMRRILFEDPAIDAVLARGFRMFYSQGSSLLTHPQLIALSQGVQDGVPVKSYWVPPRGQSEERGSPILLRVTDNIHERLSVADLIATISEAAREVQARGQTPAVALDLDGTLLNARAFTVMIFKEWLARYEGPDADEIRTMVALKNIKAGWNSGTILRDLGVTRQETIDEALKYFNANFYSPVRRLEVPPVDGTIELVKLMQLFGVKAVYTTLRSSADDSLPDGSSVSKTVLHRLAIFDEQSVLLRHEGDAIDWSEAAYKSGKNEPDKWRMVKSYRKRHPDTYFIAVADNAPSHTNGYREFFKHDIINIHVDGDLPPHSPPVQDGVYTVKPTQLKFDLAQWHQGMKESGRSAAAELVDQVSGIQDAVSSTAYRHHAERFEEALREATRTAAEALGAMAELHPAHPAKKAFLGELCRSYADGRESLETFEDVLEAVNHHHGTRFTVIRDRRGIGDIVSLDDAAALALLPPPPAPVETPIATIDPRRAPAVEKLNIQLRNEPFGPQLEHLNTAHRYDALSFGHYPRMNAALGSIINAIATSTRKRPGSIVAVEYGPRLAIGGMLALARMGVDVRWRETNEGNRLQTERELARAPEALRSRIRHLPKEEQITADLAVWNMPHADTPFSELSREVAIGGFVALQSQHPASYYESSTPNASFVSGLKLGNSECVMPTAYAHVGTPIVPLSFQVWKVR